MADLTLERIAELRERTLCTIADGWSGTTIDAKELKELLDAAERGLANGWVRNGPDVEKPKGFSLLWRVGACRVGLPVVGEWHAANDEWDTDDTDSCGEMVSRGDAEISHFMPIKEPTDADR